MIRLDIPARIVITEDRMLHVIVGGLNTVIGHVDSDKIRAMQTAHDREEKRAFAVRAGAAGPGGPYPAGWGGK
jgi:hypothetical protein